MAVASTEVTFRWARDDDVVSFRVIEDVCNTCQSGKVLHVIRNWFPGVQQFSNLFFKSNQGDLTELAWLL